jgi:hypothetical protein
VLFFLSKRIRKEDDDDSVVPSIAAHKGLNTLAADICKSKDQDNRFTNCRKAYRSRVLNVMWSTSYAYNKE